MQLTNIIYVCAHDVDQCLQLTTVRCLLSLRSRSRGCPGAGRSALLPAWERAGKWPFPATSELIGSRNARSHQWQVAPSSSVCGESRRQVGPRRNSAWHRACSFRNAQRKRCEIVVTIRHCLVRCRVSESCMNFRYNLGPNEQAAGEQQSSPSNK